MRARMLVLAGGALGTGLRYASFRIWVHRPGTFPATTLVVNALGALLLGLFTGSLRKAVAPATVSHKTSAPPGSIVAFWRVGVLGGFTTFSAYTVELAEFIRDGRTTTAAAYATWMTTVGIVAVVAGVALGNRLRVARWATR